jgi:hypothetical protein
MMTLSAHNGRYDSQYKEEGTIRKRQSLFPGDCGQKFGKALVDQ